MDARRVVLEVGREAARPGTFRILAGYVAVAGLLAYGFRDNHGFFLTVTYLAVPVFVAPFAAWTVARDRDRGLAPALATTPLTRVESVAAKSVFLALFIVAAILLTLPTLMAVLATAGPHALRATMPYSLWALLVGGTSAAGGLLAGTLATRHGTHAISGAFGIAVAWFTISQNVREIVGAADSSIGREVALTLVHMSPLTWAYDRLATTVHSVRASPTDPAPAWGAFLLLVAFAALFLVVHLGLQHVDDWWRPLARRPWALALAAALSVGCVAGIASWDFAVAEARASGGTTAADHIEEDFRMADGALVFDYEGISRVERDGRIGEVHDGAIVQMRFTVGGRELGNHTVTEVSVASPHFTLEAMDAPPYVIEIADRGPTGRWGPLDVRYRLHYGYAGELSPVTIGLMVDGEESVFHTRAKFRVPAADPEPILAAAAVPAAIILVAATAMHRRLNRW